MRKFMSLMLALVMVLSVTVIAFSAADTNAAPVGAETATVILIDVKGETFFTREYKVGETFTAYTVLNCSEINGGGIGSFRAEQTYTSSVLELADAYSEEDGMIVDLDAMFPITKQATVANGRLEGMIAFNASVASLTNSFKFDSDESMLIVSNYKVIAPGNAEIRTSFRTLAASDFNLTRIIDKGVIVNDNFTTMAYATEPAVETGSTVSGTVTSYDTTANSANHVVKVQILNGEEVIGEDSAVGENSFSYSIGNVPDGTYTLCVSKPNHVTRNYELTVSGDTAKDAKICPIGDTNNDGLVTTADAARANSQARGKNAQLDDYMFACADVLSPFGEMTTADAARINAHARNKSKLWAD